MKIRDLPPIDLVLLTHAHFDHFHKPTLRKLPHPKIGVMPLGRRRPGAESRLRAHHRAGLVGEFFAARLEGDVHAEQALGRADAARPSPRLRRICAGASGPENLSRGRQRVFRRVQGNRRAARAGNRAAAHRRVSPGNVPPRPHGAGRGGEGVQGFARATGLVPMHYGTFRLSFEAWTSRRAGCAKSPRGKISPKNCACWTKACRWCFEPSILLVLLVLAIAIASNRGRGRARARIEIRLTRRAKSVFCRRQ